MLSTESCISSPKFAVELPVILDKLCMFDLEEHIDEVIHQIYHEDFDHNRYNRGVSDWGVQETVRWMQSLKFLGEESEDICNTLRKECIDGNCLMTLSEHDWVHTLKLNVVHFILVRIIMQGWKMGPSDWVVGHAGDTPIGTNGHIPSSTRMHLPNYIFTHRCGVWCGG